MEMWKEGERESQKDGKEMERNEYGKVKFILCRLLYNLRRFVNAVVGRERGEKSLGKVHLMQGFFPLNLMVVVQHTMK